MSFTTLQVLQLGLLAGALFVLALAGFQQRRYLALKPRIETTAEFEDFKKFVRAQMHWTVVALVMAAPAIALIFVDSELKPSLAKRVVLWLPFGVMGLGGILVKGQEKKIQDPARCVELLRPEFERICFSWKKRMLPDF